MNWKIPSHCQTEQMNSHHVKKWRPKVLLYKSERDALSPIHCRCCQLRIALGYNNALRATKLSHTTLHTKLRGKSSFLNLISHSFILPIVKSSFQNLFIRRPIALTAKKIIFQSKLPKMIRQDRKKQQIYTYQTKS